MEVERKGDIALVGLEDLHECAAELLADLVGLQDDAEAGDERFAQVAEQGDLLDLEAVRGLLALGALLGLDEVAGGNLPFDEDLRVQLHIGQQGLVVLAEEGELVGPVEVLHDHAGAR